MSVSSSGQREREQRDSSKEAARVKISHLKGYLQELCLVLLQTLSHFHSAFFFNCLSLEINNSGRERAAYYVVLPGARYPLFISGHCLGESHGDCIDGHAYSILEYYSGEDSHATPLGDSTDPLFMIFLTS